jgi:antibiotic biosynthesis monooxygenase (ABM) superfamily enzyme
MRKKKGPLPAYAEATKDTRFAGTFEVFVPVEGRVKPHRMATQFASLHEAESWIHSPDGETEIAEIRRGGGK